MITETKLTNGSVTASKLGSAPFHRVLTPTRMLQQVRPGFVSADKSELDGIQAGATAGGGSASFPTAMTEVEAMVGFNNSEQNIIHTTGTAPNYYTGPPSTRWCQHGNKYSSSMTDIE